MNIKDKTILITGAANGIGFEVLKHFVKMGAFVYNLDLNGPLEIIENTKFIKCDITNSKSILNSLNLIDRKIDILFNNAGIMRRGKLLDTTEDEFDLLFNVNVKGQFLILKYLKDKLYEDSIIIQMSSRHGIYLPKDPAFYAITKEISSSIGKILDKTYNYNIKTLYPGPVETQISKVQVSDIDYNKKKKIMIKPSNLAKMIIELIQEDHKNLIYDEIKNEYYFE